MLRLWFFEGNFSFYAVEAFFYPSNLSFKRINSSNSVTFALFSLVNYFLAGHINNFILFLSNQIVIEIAKRNHLNNLLARGL
jgi:hypothetical protein